jgi:hypothetical protein
VNAVVLTSIPPAIQVLLWIIGAALLISAGLQAGVLVRKNPVRILAYKACDCECSMHSDQDG